MVGEDYDRSLAWSEKLLRFEKMASISDRFSCVFSRVFVAFLRVCTPFTPCSILQ